MKNITVNCNNIEISNNKKVCLIAGPCQLETEQHAMDMAGKIKEITSKFNMGFIYKTSFDKANRTSLKGKRGAGLDKSLPVFDKIKKELDVPILTDVHNIDQCSIVSGHVTIFSLKFSKALSNALDSHSASLLSKTTISSAVNSTLTPFLILCVYAIID